MGGRPLGRPAGADVNGGVDVNGGAYGMPSPIGGGMPELDDPFGLHLPATGTTFVGDDGAPPTDMFAEQRAAIADELKRLIARASGRRCVRKRVAPRPPALMAARRRADGARRPT